jgi:nucleoside-diphosphate-sugar epimerase
MNVIVTGSKGFLGKRVCNALKQMGNTVFGYDIIDGNNICNKDQFKTFAINNECVLVIHLAAVSNLNIYQQNINIGEQINIVGTKNILETCQELNMRLLFASTCCAYGNNNTHPSDETSPTMTTEPYALSKLESEKDILEIGLPHCCMRLATFYGPEMRKELAPAIFLHNIHNDLPIDIHGSGKQTRTLTYVDDIVSGIMTIAHTEPKYDIINITTTEIVSVLDMIKVSENIIDKKANTSYCIDRDHQIYEEIILNDRLQDLGWKCNTSFINGMEKSYEWYKNNGSEFD